MPDNKKFGDVPTMFSLDNKSSKGAIPNPLKIESEFSDHYNTWSTNKSPANNDQILQRIQPIIDTALKTYVGQDVPPSVRLQAKRMALEGLNNYDPNKSKLKTHLMWHMQGLKRASNKANQILNVPERVQIDSRFVNNAFNELSEQLGRDPSDSELANHTGLSIKRINTVRSFKPGIAEGAATQSMFSGEDDNINDPSVSIPGRDTGDAWKSFVYDGLDDRSKLVMEHTFGMHGKPVIDNVTLARKLRITPARISQIRSEIQKKIDSRSRIGIL